MIVPFFHRRMNEDFSVDKLRFFIFPDSLIEVLPQPALRFQYLTDFVDDQLRIRTFH